MPECQKYYLNAAVFENFCKQEAIDGKTIEAKINGIPVTLKVASTPESQAQGFSNGTQPSGNNGILFVYPVEADLAFWMKDVGFPLDIIFFDKNKNSIGLPCNMQPEYNKKDHQLKRYTSTKPAMYAVELPSGWCLKNQNDNGYKLEL